MRSQLTDYGLGFNKIPMYYDKKRDIAFCCNNVQHSQSKHINIRYHFIKEQVENWVIELYFVNTEYQLADLFTKALGRDRIEFLINKLCMRSFTPETLKQLTDEVDETIDMMIDQQVALDEALVPHACRLRIGRSNFRLLSDTSSKESALQLVYDVLPLTPFFKAFLVIVDVPKIYMQEFWVTAMVCHHSIWFKMDNKKHIVNLESLREMLHICPRLPGQTFDEPSFEEEILAFLRSIGHTQFLWGFYNKRSVDFTYLLWEDFVYQVEHKDTKKINEMYYPRLTKVIINHFMSKDPSIRRRNKVNWHYVRDDQMLTTIKLEYYAVATGATAPKTKASVRKTKSSSNTTVTPPPTATTGTRLFTSAKGKQPATTSKAKSQTHISQASGSGVDERTGTIPGVPNVPTKESNEEISWKSSDEGDDDDDDEERDDGDDDEDEHDDDDAQDDDDDQEDENKDDDDQEERNDEDDQEEGKTRDEESFDPIPKTPENTNDEGNGEENLGMNVGREEGQDEEDEEDELYRDVNTNLGRGIQMADVHTTQEFEDSHVTLTLVVPLSVSTPTLTPSTIATITTIQQAPTPPTTAPSILLQDLPNFGSLFGFDHRLKTLEANFSEFMQTNQFVRAISSIPKIVQRYKYQWMNEAVKVAVQIQSDRLRDEAQAENDEFLKTIDENMQKIIKEQVKEHVNVQVSKVLSKIEQTMNEQLKAKVLTRSSNSSKTSYVVAADLLEMELKKILIEKIECNKSIHRSNEQRNLYKALVEAYESDKIILDTYEDTVILKRRRDDDADKDEESSARSDRGSKRQREGKELDKSVTAEEPMQTTHEIEEPSHPEFEIGADDQPIAEPYQHPEWFSQQKKPSTPDRDWNKTFSSTHGSIQPWISELAKQSDSRSSFNKLMDTPVDFSAFLMNRLKVDTLTPELLAGPTYKLIKGSCKILEQLEFFLEEVYKATTDQLDWVNPKGQQYPHNMLKPLPLVLNSRGHRGIPFDHFINNDLEYLCGGASSRKYTTYVTTTKAADYGHIKWIEDLVPRIMWIQEPVGYDKHALWGISHWGRTRQYIVIQRRVEDLQLCFESYQKKLNLTRPDTYRSDLKRKEAYIAYSNPRGFIYHNKDKQNRLMRIDELHKFSDGTLTDVHTTLDNHLKGIRMKYLP
nr:ribonuclease H [Tanacetum cinerariifolium]